jgi:hypothetical protein
MGANKVVDDVNTGGFSLKFVLDSGSAGTIKVIDDPKLKVLDDPVGSLNKFVDDPSIKHYDDPSHKFLDDPSHKIIDDPKSKWVDDPIYKAPSDPINIPDPWQMVTNPAQYMAGAQMAGAQPFILSTPHHSMQWAQSFGQGAASPNDPNVMIAQYELYGKQLDVMKQNLQSQIRRLEEYQDSLNQEVSKLRDQQGNTGNQPGR